MYSTKKLSEIFENIQYGFTGKTQESGKYRLLRITDIQDHSIVWKQVPFVDITDSEAERYLLKKGDIVFARTGATVGKSCTINEDGEGQIFASYLIRVSGGNNEVNANYIQYFFQSENYWKQIYADVVGSAQPNFNGTKLKNLEIPLPPLSTQSRIVARLDTAFASIDEQISLLRANIADVENMRKSVLEESFQSGEYEAKKLEEIVSFLSGGTPSKSNKDFWIGDIPWISPKDMKQDKLDSGTDYISQSAVDSSATKLLPINSLLCVTRSGILVRSFPVAINIVPVAFNQDIRAMIPGKNIDSEYLFYALQARENEVLSNGIKKGPTVHSIISGYLDKLQIPLPPLPRQHEIVAHLDRVFETTRALRAEYEEQIRDLSTLKQSLLEEAFAGRLVTEEIDLQL